MKPLYIRMQWANCKFPQNLATAKEQDNSKILRRVCFQKAQTSQRNAGRNVALISD